ncbi:hypothetical protein [Streptomyces noursei]|uniref:hypothetical protein n=1 Tax=Streptomyces noursei TaxID=1971 RepID=UPI0019BDB3CF|nr:hypothetical protein [Streptomyces noursei]MCZ1018978.1 hypothetical protein [Streptomyces noursei]GGX52757.1 hypothetical protein GCM10010341_87640 [Streptomyces noursei]
MQKGVEDFTRGNLAGADRKAEQHRKQQCYDGRGRPANAPADQSTSRGADRGSGHRIHFDMTKTG